MIEVVRVSKVFGNVQAVSDISFTVEAGRVTGLLGPNGAGKTTLIRMITAFFAPSGGWVRVCGHDTVEASEAARAMLGYLPESAPLYPEMSVEGYLRYRADLFGVPRPIRAAVERAISRCWLGEMRSRRISALSKGYRQRVALAAALLHDPKVLVLDEPTTGLDPTQIKEMRELVRELAVDRTLLLSSHILPEVEQTCDRVLIVARGRLRADGAPAALLEPLRRAAPYLIEAVGGDEARLADAIRPVAGVRAIRALSSAGASAARLEVSPAHDAPDLREPLARAAAAAGMLVRELHRPGPTLEQFFVKAISEEAATEATAGAAA